MFGGFARGGPTVGYTSKNVNERFHEHLSGTNQWTRQNGPFVLIHTESFNDKQSAMRREYYLKSCQCRKWLDENIRG
ncbi:GIY-YIG nuclease family protein [Candidatus Falkowbacteria bacterium]|nr:GIY-YIG nuclease family protein [Candidatus Falkowbacteria bacterium]